MSWIISEYLDKGEPTFQFYARTLKGNARYVFQNEGRAAIGIPNQDAPIALEFLSKNWTLIPKNNVGNVHPGEELILSNFDGQTSLVYGQDGRMVLKEAISQSAIRSLLTAYVMRPFVR